MSPPPTAKKSASTAHDHNKVLEVQHAKYSGVPAVVVSHLTSSLHKVILNGSCHCLDCPCVVLTSASGSIIIHSSLKMFSTVNIIMGWPFSKIWVQARIRQQTGEERAGHYLLQQLSVAVQRGNSVSIRGSVGGLSSSLFR